MKTRELIELLRQLDPTGDLEVIETRCSDYGHMSAEDWSVVEAVPRPFDGYLMRAHPTMSDEDKARARRFVHFEGN